MKHYQNHLLSNHHRTLVEVGVAVPNKVGVEIKVEAEVGEETKLHLQYQLIQNNHLNNLHSQIKCHQHQKIRHPL